jgi:hypothetical protein
MEMDFCVVFCGTVAKKTLNKTRNLMITLPEIPEYSFTGTKNIFTNNKTYPMLHLA